MSVRTFCRVWGAFTFVSLVVWGLTGVGLWSPLQEGDIGRGFVLCTLHVAGLMAGAFSLAMD